MIPKHIQEKIDDYCVEAWGKADAIASAEYGYTLAMEQMKPILDAAREVCSNDADHIDLQNLKELINQHDNEQGN